MVGTGTGTGIKNTTGIILESGIDIYGCAYRTMIVNGLLDGTGGGNTAGTADKVGGVYRIIFGTIVTAGSIGGGIGITTFHGNTIVHIIITPPAAVTTISMAVAPDQELFGQII
jgi:hypothetical protein